MAHQPTKMPIPQAASFAELGVDHKLVQVLNRLSIEKPFDIQAACIPSILRGKDVLGKGPTGSGKTFAFGLPALQLLSAGHSIAGKPRGLILAPTRELANQISTRLTDLGAAVGLRVASFFGGTNVNKDVTNLASPLDLMVATPGRAQDLVNRGALDLSAVVITIVDEADQMADMGFLPQVTKLLDKTPKKCQRLLFSATLDNQVSSLVKRYMHSPLEFSTTINEGGVDTMTHYLFVVQPGPERNKVIASIAARKERTIIFVRIRYRVDSLVKKLRAQGIAAVGLHGDKAQSRRQKAIEEFSTGDATVLVATDIAARGIDIKNVSLVVHADPPGDHKAYLHRAGRTARGGADGTIVTLSTPDQLEKTKKLLKKAGISATEIEVHPGDRRLADITGAREPSGDNLNPPKQNPGNSSRSRGRGRGQLRQGQRERERHGRSSRGRNSSRRRG